MKITGYKVILPITKEPATYLYFPCAKLADKWVRLELSVNKRLCVIYPCLDHINHYEFVNTRKDILREFNIKYDRQWSFNTKENGI